MAEALPSVPGTSPRVGGFLVPVPANDNRPLRAANDNLPGSFKPARPYGPRPASFGYRPGISPALLVYSQLQSRLEGWALYEFQQLLRGITYIGAPNVNNSPGWHKTADCANGPGNFMGSFADPVYCGPIPEPSPGGILEDPTSYNIKFYQFHPELGVGEWRFHELWSAVKWDGVTLYPPPAVVYDVAAMPLPSPWPWNKGWRQGAKVGWSSLLENVDPVPTPRTPTVRTPGVTVDFPPVVYRPPGKGRKEVKLSGGGGLAGLGWAAANIASEIGDFVTALEKGLPAKLRAHPVWQPGGSEFNWRWDPMVKRWLKEAGSYRAPTIQEKASAIYDGWSHMDWTAAMGAVATSEVQDRLYGRIGRVMRKANRAAGRPLGYQSGPWDNQVPKPRLSF